MIRAGWPGIAQSVEHLSCLTLWGSGTIDPGLKPHQCLDWNSLATMLATKRSEGVTPEVNLKILLHTGDEAYKWWHLPWIETKGRCYQKFKIRISVAPQKDWWPPKIKKKTLWLELTAHRHHISIPSIRHGGIILWTLDEARSSQLSLDALTPI